MCVYIYIYILFIYLYIYIYIYRYIYNTIFISDMFIAYIFYMRTYFAILRRLAKIHSESYLRKATPHIKFHFQFSSVQCIYSYIA